MLSSHDRAPVFILQHRAKLSILQQVEKLREFWQGCSHPPWVLLFGFPALGINHHRDR